MSPPSFASSPRSSPRKKREDRKSVCTTSEDDSSRTPRRREKTRQASAPPPMRERNSLQWSPTDVTSGIARGDKRRARRNALAEDMSSGRVLLKPRSRSWTPESAQGSFRSVGSRLKVPSISKRSESITPPWLENGGHSKELWESSTHATYKVPIPEAYSQSRHWLRSGPVTSVEVMLSMRDGSWGKHVPNPSGEKISVSETQESFSDNSKQHRHWVQSQEPDESLVPPLPRSSGERRSRSAMQPRSSADEFYSKGSRGSATLTPRTLRRPTSPTSLWDKSCQTASTPSTRSGSAPPLKLESSGGLGSSTGRASPGLRSNATANRPASVITPQSQRPEEHTLQLPVSQPSAPTPAAGYKPPQHVLASNAGVNRARDGWAWTPMSKGATTGDWSWTPRPGFSRESPAWKGFRTSPMSPPPAPSPPSPAYPSQDTVPALAYSAAL